MDSDALSVASDTSVDLAAVIDNVEVCLANFERVVEDRYLQFRAPAPGTDRATIWTKYGITERLEIEHLEQLLGDLAAHEDRNKPWFTWLQWLFWDYN
jgi:hypothetical protein